MESSATADISRSPTRTCFRSPSPSRGLFVPIAPTFGPLPSPTPSSRHDTGRWSLVRVLPLLVLMLLIGASDIPTVVAGSLLFCYTILKSERRSTMRPHFSFEKDHEKFPVPGSQVPQIQWFRPANKLELGRSDQGLVPFLPESCLPSSSVRKTTITFQIGKPLMGCGSEGDH